MIYTITLWADNLNPYKPHTVAAKILIDCEDIKLEGSNTVITTDSKMTFPNNTATLTEGDLT